MSFASPSTAGLRATEPYPFLLVDVARDPVPLAEARHGDRAPLIDDMRACDARAQWRQGQGRTEKSAGRRLNSRLLETGGIGGWSERPNRIGVARVSDGDERRGAKQNLAGRGGGGMFDS